MHEIWSSSKIESRCLTTYYKREDSIERWIYIDWKFYRDLSIEYDRFKLKSYSSIYVVFLYRVLIVNWINIDHDSYNCFERFNSVRCYCQNERYRHIVDYCDYNFNINCYDHCDYNLDFEINIKFAKMFEIEIFNVFWLSIDIKSFYNVEKFSWMLFIF